MAHEQHQACIETCEECANACDHCSTACLTETDIAMLARCIQLDMDCSQLCRYAAGAMARGSEFAGDICQLCADVCDACADECSKHKIDHCQACAEACRRCAQVCRDMAGHMKAQHPRRPGPLRITTKDGALIAVSGQICAGVSPEHLASMIRQGFVERVPSNLATRVAVKRVVDGDMQRDDIEKGDV